MFSLVDKRAGFSNPAVVGSNPGSVIFFFHFFSIKYIESAKMTGKLFTVALSLNKIKRRQPRPQFMKWYNQLSWLFG